MTNTHETTNADFQELKAKVLEKKPVLAEILRKTGDKNLFSYALEYIDININPPIKKRQKQLIETFKTYVQSLLGETIAQKAAEQLKKYYYVSTADHHGPICHPFFINSNLIAAAPYHEYSDPTLKYFFVLACSGISFDNSSFPRGLVFHSAADSSQMQQLGFFSYKAHSCPVFNYRAYDQSDIERVKIKLQDKVGDKSILAQEADIINKLIDDVYLDKGALACEKFSDQITKTNFQLWKRFFHEHDDAPDLIYLDQEKLVSQLILDHHIDNDTTIRRILFDPSYHELITTYFDDIPSAFSTKDGWGTFLFWGLPKGQRYRVQLWKNGNELSTKDGSYRVALTPQAIRQALESGEIFPGLLLDFIILSFYYGLKCLGGFSQVNYLTFMKNAYIKMMADRGNYKSIEVCARAQTKELCGDVTLAFIQDANGKLLPATGIDLILHSTDNTWPQLVDLSKNISLEEALNPMMPDFYKIIYPENQRNQRLEKITADDIARLTGLNKKIKPCIQLR